MSQAPAPPAEQIQRPPPDIPGILMKLGPGLIIAGSIVGSGELIGTTKTGAEAGFWLLWLIIIGCVIKVFVQVELGRDAIVRGQTTMAALGEVPGPRVAGRGNWLLWYYFIMFAASIGQLGGIVGGVGQAMAISLPITAQGREFNGYLTLKTQKAVTEAELKVAEAAKDESRAGVLRLKASELGGKLQEYGPDYEQRSKHFWSDERIWALLLAVGTSILLVVGRYGLIEVTTTALVAAFTLMTVLSVVLLQTTATWS